MCVACRDRFPQHILIRMQCENRELIPYSDVGRSFYLCKSCIDKDDKNLVRALSSRCKRSMKITDLKRVVDG